MRRPGSGVLVEEYCLILAWCRIPAAQQSCTFVARFSLLWSTRCFLQQVQFQSSTWTLLWSHAVVMDAVCSAALSCWNMHPDDGGQSIQCCSCYYFRFVFSMSSKLLWLEVGFVQPLCFTNAVFPKHSLLGPPLVHKNILPLLHITPVTEAKNKICVFIQSWKKWLDHPCFLQFLVPSNIWYH